MQASYIKNTGGHIVRLFGDVALYLHDSLSHDRFRFGIRFFQLQPAGSGINHEYRLSFCRGRAYVRLTSPTRNWSMKFWLEETLTSRSEFKIWV
jgi:hypothetical protein